MPRCVATIPLREPLEHPEGLPYLCGLRICSGPPPATRTRGKRLPAARTDRLRKHTSPGGSILRPKGDDNRVGGTAKLEYGVGLGRVLLGTPVPPCYDEVSAGDGRWAGPLQAHGGRMIHVKKILPDRFLQLLEPGVFPCPGAAETWGEPHRLCPRAGAAGDKAHQRTAGTGPAGEPENPRQPRPPRRRPSAEIACCAADAGIDVIVIGTPAAPAGPARNGFVAEGDARRPCLVPGSSRPRRPHGRPHAAKV